MDDPSSNSIPAELRVSLDVTITVDGLRSDADQPKLESALTGTPGIETLDFLEGALTIRYDPQRVTEAQLREKIRRAGFQVAQSDAEPVAQPIGPVDGTYRP